MADRATTGLVAGTDGALTIRKQDLGRHLVHDDGEHDGEGRMWVHGRIAGSPLTGRWMIAQRRDIALQDDRLTQIVDLNDR